MLVMKKALFIAGLFLFCIVSGVNAQDKKGVLEGNSTNPEITFEKTEHDYGTMKKGADTKMEFKFKNTGKSPLILNNVKASCGCTTPTWPKEPIAPGKSGSIKVEYDSKRIGPFTKSITVTSNAKTPSTELIIKGVVEDDIKKPQ